MIATVFNLRNKRLQTGTCCFINDDDKIFSGNYPNVGAEAETCLREKKSVVKEYDDHCILYQFMPPSIQLVLVGAGNDAQPLTKLAYLLGWDTIIADGRPTYATRGRFPQAGRICLVKPSEVLSATDIDDQTAVVLMTHNYNYDLAALEQLIATNCRFIGVLGPKKKFQKMLDDLTVKTIKIDSEIMNRIYSPVGLDIGAETSEEIALSILAEIKAVFSNRNGASLKERIIEIHERSTIWQHE